MVRVALVVLDTLRKDAFDEHFTWLPGRRFENAWAPSHWTVPVHASMFTGRYPSELGVHANAETLDCPEPVVAEQLSAVGYDTAAFSSNGNISDYFDFDRGFDTFEENWRAEGWRDELKLKDSGDVFDWKRFNANTSHTGWRRRIVGTWRSIAGEYNTGLSLRHGLRRKLRGPGSPTFDDRYSDFGATEALDFVRARQPGADDFLFVNLMEAHNPYDAPPEYQTVEPVRIDGLRAAHQGPDDDPEHVKAAYDDCVRYLSDMYREIFAELESDYDWVISVSDHGELLGEHDRWEHLCGLYPELVHVPLVISGPSVDDGTSDRLVSLLDIHATILARADLPGSGRGHDLLTTTDEQPWLTEYHGLSRLHTDSLEDDLLNELAYLDRQLDGLVAPRDYYGFETATGEFEESGTTNITDPRACLKSLREEVGRREPAAQSYDDMNAETEQRLRDLGYM